MNLSIAQKQMAPTTRVMRISIKSESNGVSCYFEAEDLEPDEVLLLAVQQPKNKYPGHDRHEIAKASHHIAQGYNQATPQGQCNSSHYSEDNQKPAHTALPIICKIADIIDAFRQGRAQASAICGKLTEAPLRDALAFGKGAAPSKLHCGCAGAALEPS